MFLLHDRTDERLENVGLFSVSEGNIHSEISLGCQGNDTQNMDFSTHTKINIVQQ